MAWDYYLNIEPLALQAAKDATEAMTGSNYTEVKNPDGSIERIPANRRFLQNFEHGFTALFMITAYYESALNTLLREVKGCEPEGEELRKNHDEKIELLFAGRPDDLKRIRGTLAWNDLQRAIRMRNQLTHYKNTCAGVLSSWAPIASWKLDGARGESLGAFFTRATMRRLVGAAQTVVKAIAECFNLHINPYVAVLMADGASDAHSYFCNNRQLKELREIHGGASETSV